MVKAPLGKEPGFKFPNRILVGWLDGLVRNHVVHLKSSSVKQSPNHGEEPLKKTLGFKSPNRILVGWFRHFSGFNHVVHLVWVKS